MSQATRPFDTAMNAMTEPMNDMKDLMERMAAVQTMPPLIAHPTAAAAAMTAVSFGAASQMLGMMKSGRSKAASAPEKAPARPARKPSDDGAGSPGQPDRMEKPAEPDDLKMISGVGPKLEEKLNGLGIWTFAQVASWKKAERDWVDETLNFHGRIERDDWVKQAKALAKGGEDEYVRVFGKKPR